MSKPLFDPRLIAQCVLTDRERRKFMLRSRQRIFRDQETGARVVCEVHEDGRILIDAVRLPTPDRGAGRDVNE